MNLAAFARMLLRRGWLAVAVGALAALLGLAFAVTQTPVFEAETRVAVRPKRPADLGQTQAIKESMRSYIQDIGTLDMAEAVSVRLADDPRCRGYDLDPNVLRWQRLRVGSDENVYEIQIRARSPDENEAVCISEKWAETFVDRREKTDRQLDPLDRIITEQRDDTTPHRVWPRRRLIVLAAALAGLALGGALVLLLEYLESAVVRDAGEAELVAGVPVLGTMPPTGADRPTTGAVRQGLGELRAVTARLARLAWPAVLMAALGAASAFGLSSLRTTVHRARTKIAVEPARGSDWGQTQGIRETMRGFSEDIKTRRMAAQVNERLQLDMKAEALLDKLSVAPNESDYEIHVDVRDTDAGIAEDISRTWAQLFVEERDRANYQLDQRDRILTRLRDRTVSEPWSPKRMPNTLAGAVLGAIVGAGAAFVLHVSRRGVILTPADADHAAGAPLLGVVPPAAGGREAAAQRGARS